MKAVALAQRLLRDLKPKSLADLAVDQRLEIADAINASLQKMHDLAPPHSKQTKVPLYAPAPESITVTVESGSATITGADSSHAFRTIRIEGDGIDNQITGDGNLLHPYSGESGTVSAVIYGDAVSVPATIAEIASDPMILETRTRVVHDPHRRVGSLDYGTRHISSQKRSGRPVRWWMDSQAENQNPLAPAVIRFNTLPDRAYRMEADAVMAPLRIGITDLLDSSSSTIPIRAEHVEAYLIPLCRGELATSSMWMNDGTRQNATDKAEKALESYAMLAPKTLATPNNRVGTPKGF